MYTIIYKFPNDKWNKLVIHNRADALSLIRIKKLRMQITPNFPNGVFRIQHINKPLPGNHK